MEPRIHDGDLALVHRQDTLENGDLGVLIYGDEGEGDVYKRQCLPLSRLRPRCGAKSPRRKQSSRSSP